MSEKQASNSQDLENQDQGNLGNEGDVNKAAVEKTAGNEDVSGDEGEGNQDDQGKQNQYVPNYKFRVHDNDYEIDEELRPVIKDKKTEDKIRAILSKAYGLDEVQKSRDSWKTKYDETSKTYSEVKKEYDMYARGRDMYLSGDVIGAARYFFKPNDLMKIAIEMAKYNELPEDQKIRVDNEYATRYKTRDLEEQQEEALQRANQAEIKATQATIDYELTRPDIADLAKKVDDLYAKPGYFREKIREYGHSNWLSGRQLTPQQCIQAVVDDYKPIVARIAPIPSNQNVGDKVVTKTGANNAPNLKSSGSAGRTVLPKTMSDITKKREALEAANRDRELD